MVVDGERPPGSYLLDARTVVLLHDDQYLLIAPSRQNWTKVSSGAYQFLIECAHQPIKEFLGKTKAQYGFAPQEVIAFLTELRRKGVIFFDTDPGPSPGTNKVGNGATRSAFLNVTRRCNLACPTCLASATPLPVSDDAPLSVWQEIMDKLADGKVSTVIVTGGEPTLRSDLPQLLAQARERFERVFLNTNGTLLTPDLCSQLKPLVDQLHLSVDGSTAEIHEWFRGKGTFARTMQGLELLKEAGVQHIGLTPTVTKVNIHDLPNMAHLAIKSGVALRTSVFLPVGRGTCNASTLSPTPKDLVRAFVETHRVLLDYADESIDQQKTFMGAFGAMKLACGTARTTVSLTGDGTVFPCNALCDESLALGNLLTSKGLVPLLNTSPIAARFEKMTVDTREVCHACDVRYFCGGGCVAYSHLAHGDLEAEDPFCPLYRSILRAQIWTVRGDASLRDNVQAMVAWLDSVDGSRVPVEMRWDA